MSFSYARGENSSFVHARRGAYIACMKNRYPTAQELYALEQEARRLRAVEMARLFRAGAAAVRRFFAAQPAKGLRHA
jgi:hypothetical protein